MVKYYLTGKIRKKERIEKKKSWFGKEVVEIPVYDTEITSKKDTLYGEVKEFAEILKEHGIAPDPKALEEVFEHTHPRSIHNQEGGGIWYRIRTIKRGCHKILDPVSTTWTTASPRDGRR